MANKDMTLNDAPKTSPAKPTVLQPPSKPNGESEAEAISKGREALLGVETYEQAEQLLSKNPDLVEQARAVFGAIVPTSGQNVLIDLAIKAAAEDDPTDLRRALAAKRKQALNLTAPEVGQLLEFAGEQISKTPVLALNVALLLTDDLTRLEDPDLWQQQKDVVLALEKSLDLDAASLWDDISGAKPKPAPKSEPVQVRVKVESSPRMQKRTAPPAGKAGRVKNGGPSRLLLVGGFILLMSAISCGACALGNWF